MKTRARGSEGTSSKSAADATSFMEHKAGEQPAHAPGGLFGLDATKNQDGCPDTCSDLFALWPLSCLRRLEIIVVGNVGDADDQDSHPAARAVDYSRRDVDQGALGHG